MKVLLLAYEISPYKGSECAVAWNHVKYISTKHQVTVIYGSSGKHMGDDDDMMDYFKKSNLENVDFRHVCPEKWANVFNYPNRNGFLKYSFYLAYRFWHKTAYNYCLNNLDMDSFDVIHYLNPIGYREPGYLWKFDKPYVWGPVGGANSIDKRLLVRSSLSAKINFLFRNTSNWLQLRYSFRLKKALNRSNLFLTATTENQKLFSKIHGKKSLYIPENGPTGVYKGLNKIFCTNGKINIVWVGRVDARKSLKLLIDTFKHVDQPERFTVNVIGSGPLEASLKDYTRSRNLQDIFIWHGHVNRNEVIKNFKLADLHIITSMSEANTTVIWEAMQNGVPTLSIDHCGMHDIIDESTGIKIPLGSYSSIINFFAEELNKISLDPSILMKFNKNIERSFTKYHWDKRVGFFDDVYSEAVRIYNEKDGV